MRDIDALLARFPGPVTLAPNRLKMLAAFVMCAGLSVFSVYLLRRAIEAGSSEVIWASLSIVVCGILAARLALMLLLPHATGLTLDADGFAISRIFGRTRFSWRNVSRFRVEEGKDAAELRLVRFEVLSAGTAPRRGATVTRALPGNYRLSDDDLAALMTQWRALALAQPRTTSVPHVGSARPR
jgi:hypothetical protein